MGILDFLGLGDGDSTTGATWADKEPEFDLTVVGEPFDEGDGEASNEHFYYLVSKKGAQDHKQVFPELDSDGDFVIVLPDEFQLRYPDNFISLKILLELPALTLGQIIIIFGSDDKNKPGVLATGSTDTYRFRLFSGDIFINDKHVFSGPPSSFDRWLITSRV